MHSHITVLEHIDELAAVLERFKPLVPSVYAAGQMLIRTLRGGGKILTAGNGGSAADALHLAEELVGRFKADRRSLPAVCLNADPTLLTCIGNDFGYESLFSRQVEGLGASGDTLVVFSSSGNSENIVRALDSAAQRRLTSIALLGRGGGRAAGRADVEIVIPSDSTARVQEVHTLTLHLWLAMIESEEWDR